MDTEPCMCLSRYGPEERPAHTLGKQDYAARGGAEHMAGGRMPDARS